MMIALTNVKTTLQSENISVTDTNAVTQKVYSIFPDYECWSYDDNNDIIYIYRPTPPVPDSSSIGEVEYIDYTIG